MQFIITHERPKVHLFGSSRKLLDLGLILFVFSEFFLKALLPLDDIEAVSAAVKLRFAVACLDAALGDLVDEISVMAYKQNGSLEVLEIILEPFGCTQIEVVCRLVKQEYVRFFEYKARKVDPRPLSAGEQVKGLLAHALRNIKAVCNAVAVGVHIISAETRKIGREPVVFRQKLIRLIMLHFMRKLIKACANGIKLTVSILKDVLGRPSVRVDGYLRDKPEALSGGYGHRALVVVYLAREYAERGLSAAVMAENADALTLGNVEAEPVKYVFTQFKGLYKSVDGYVCHYISPKLFCYRCLKHGVYDAAGSTKAAAAAFDKADKCIGMLLIV